ncbi:MAG: alpha/beta fold hydrolase [Victivallaceae bacterium]|nr:alpha/beta fold hydrolase [Victivallaceae bacterium]
MLDVIGKYLSGRKCHFYLSPDSKNDRREIVVLIHGLIRRSLDMYVMGKFLRRHGFAVYIYDYKTSEKNLTGHGEDLRNYLLKIMAENPADIPIDIVTHSMGGILTRYALVQTQKNKGKLDISRINRIVMLAPPHGGSKVARLFVKYLPFTGRWLKPLPELSDAPASVIHTVPLIKGPEIGIIAGKYDREVALKDTYLPGMKAHCVIKSEHAFIIYLKSAHRAVLRFLTNGTFE